MYITCAHQTIFFIVSLSLCTHNHRWNTNEILLIIYVSPALEQADDDIDGYMASNNSNKENK